MLQIQKQEANANKLLVYTKAMSLTFHTVSTSSTNTVENRRLQPEHVLFVHLPPRNRAELLVLLQRIPQVLLASSQPANRAARLLPLPEDHGPCDQSN